MRLPCLISAACVAILAIPAKGQFSINLAFEGSITPAQEAVFQDAAEVWETFIVGYQPGITLGGIDITFTDAIAGDGLGGALVGNSTPQNAFLQEGYFVPTAGTVAFDPSDLGLIDHYELLIHASREIGHVLGIGTLWLLNGLSNPDSGQYVGTFGLDAYQTEFDPTAGFIPVELGGPGSIRNRHWAEVDFGTGLTGITDSQGRDFANELMTGWLGPDPAKTFISETTVMSLQDMGYQVQFVALNLIPEPAVPLLAGLAALVLLVRRSRS